MAQVRVHELAEEFAMESKAIIAMLGEIGVFPGSPDSLVEPAAEARIRGVLESDPFAEWTRLAKDPSPASTRPTRPAGSSSPRPSRAAELEILRRRQDILSLWERIQERVPDSAPDRVAWLSRASGLQRFHIHFARSVRDWTAHPNRSHQPNPATLSDALQIMKVLDRALR